MRMMPVRCETVDGLACFVLESSNLVCKILPDPGGKMIVLTDKRSGREWIKPKRPVSYRPIGYGGDYGDFDRTGFDECFPAIASADYPRDPWKGAQIPDHGEIWTIPWECEESSDGLRMHVHGVRFPYIFHKTIDVEGDGLRVSYRVENPTPCEMPCLWSAHPIFEIEKGMRAILPSCSKIVIDYSKDDRLGGYLNEITWPEARDNEGNVVDLGTFGPKNSNTADKIYACRVSEGYAALYEPQSGDYLAFTFDTSEIPHVGLWSNIGGWPSGEPDYNCALEPCNGYPDKLGNGEHKVIAPHGYLKWTLSLHLGRSDDEDSLREALRS